MVDRVSSDENWWYCTLVFFYLLSNGENDEVKNNFVLLQSETILRFFYADGRRGNARE